MQAVSEIIRFYHRLVEKIKLDDKVYTFFGTENNYPDKVYYLSKNSVTTSRSLNMMTKFIVGRGVEALNNIKINDEQNFYQFLTDLAREYILNNGVYIYADFNYNGELFNYKVLPFKSVRVGKKDDNGYNAKYFFKRDWNDKKEKKQAIYSWDTNIEVIRKRLANDNDVSGMVYFLTNEPFNIYPLSRINEVLQDAESEVLIATYKNKILKGGFYGKKIIVMPKLVNDAMDKTDPLYRKRLKQQTQINESLKNFMGVENIDTVMLINIEIDDLEQLDKVFLVKNIESDINPDLFGNIEKSISDNIRVMFNNIPDILVRSSKGIFEQSGEAFRQAKLFYLEQTENERETLENALTYVMKKAQNKVFAIDFNFEKILIDDKQEPIN